MKVDVPTLNEKLGTLLSKDINFYVRDNGMVMLNNPFMFPDGDCYPIYVSVSNSGIVRLSDQGHTLMHLSYKHHVDSLYEGEKATLREQIARQYGVQERDGELSIEAPLDHIVDSLFRLGQVITKICDLALFTRRKIETTFRRDLEHLLLKLLGEEAVDIKYKPEGIPDRDNYLVDYRLRGHTNPNVFVYGVHNQMKAIRTAVVLSHFRINSLDFESILVFDENSGKIPAQDITRLENVADTRGKSIRSLNATDISREVLKLVA